VTDSPTNHIFYAASFAIDGELLGIGEWQLSKLSPRWLEFSREVLRIGGPAFDKSLPAPFDRVRLRFTSANGVALATFSIDSAPVASSAFLRGTDSAAERQVLQMFVESSRRASVVQCASTTPEPFAKAFTISQRPLHIVIAWGTHDDDAGMVPELSTHLAAASSFGHDAA
jgi:hypothetical protein